MANPLMITDMVTIYHKPSMGGQLILRSPRSNQTSEKVKVAQANFAGKATGNKIATNCKGKKGRAFYGCLKTQGRKQFGTEPKK